MIQETLRRGVTTAPADGDGDPAPPPIAASPAMAAVLSRIPELSGHVLLHAEPGAGAHTVAAALHAHHRGAHPLVLFECAEVPALLAESTLFGHERSNCFGGGGPSIHPGALELAGAGTLVLVEIAALPLEVHRPLLRALEQRQIRRIGGSRLLSIPARVIATTRHDPGALAAAGRLRPELAAALGAPLCIPPLRERREDIGPLLRRFLGAHPLPPQLEQLEHRLAALPWPGNAAQLAAAARSLAAGADPDSLIAELQLLDAIAADPDDLAARAVYGDLLLARGDPRGELIQVQCRLAALPDHAPDRAPLLAAERALLAAHEPTWLAPVLAHPHVGAARLRRGFVESITASFHAVRDLGALFRLAPTLSDLELDPIDATLPISPVELAHAPELSRLHALRLRATGPAAPIADMLAGSPHLGRLRELSIGGTARSAWNILPAPLELDAASARTLAAAPHLGRVSTLVLERCQLDAPALRALLAPRARWRLSRLVLLDSPLDAPALAALERARRPPAIEYQGQPLPPRRTRPQP